MNIPVQILAILNKLQSSGHNAYLVGGCVRDFVMGRIPSDYDICTDATPCRVKAVFSKERVIETGLRHGTVTVITDGIPVEITTFRKDGDYTDHRRPSSIEFVKTIEADIERRDFTINAIAYDGNKITDPFGGEGDIAAGVIRCVGNARRRFGEDALRIMRMFRFAAVLGFDIDPDTLKSAADNKGLLKNIAKERIREEFNKILTSPQPSGVLRIMLDNGIFDEFIPEFTPCGGFVQNNPHHCSTISEHILNAVDYIRPELILRLSAFFHDIGKPRCYGEDDNGIGHFFGHSKISGEMTSKIMKRLRYSRKEITTVRRLVDRHMTLPENQKQMRKLIADLGPDLLMLLLELKAADISALTPSTAQKYGRELAAIKKEIVGIIESMPPVTLGDLAINGKDLLDIGIPQGKKIGETLSYLLERVIDDPQLNNREELLYQCRIKNVALSVTPPA
ncbi:MAG: HD domain-containing protein [Oscillospiraceae bacterium]|nr:HD domain-containing protein [Oscillospiraceae bacterium]